MFRVLIVDDEELALVSLQYSFPWREYGFTDILTATDSREALEILKNQRIDAAFVDIRMPNLSGLDLAGLAQESGLDTIFVIVSGYSDFAYAKEAIGYGVLDYCLKPVSEEEAPGLLSKLRSRILSRRYSHDSQYAHSLLAEEGRCRDLLHHMFRNSERKGDMALLYLCGSNMWDMLSQWDSFPPEEVLFWGEQDALLLWGKSPAKDLLEAFFAKYEHSALLLYDVAWPDVLTFQNALRRIRMERELSETGRTGVVRFLSISDEMKSCFGSLIAYMEENFAQSLTLKDLAHQ